VNCAALSVVFVGLFMGQTARANPPLDVEMQKRSGQIEVLAHVGTSTVPFGVAGLEQAQGEAFVFAVTGRYGLSRPLSLALTVPLVLGNVTQPAGSYVTTNTFGNPSAGIRSRFYDWVGQQSDIAVSGSLSVGLPVAHHEATLQSNRLLAIADGIEGRGLPEWFTPGVLPITPSVTLVWRSSHWTIQTDLKTPFLVRTSEAHLPSRANPRPVGVAGVLALEASYQLSRRFSLAVGARLFVDILPVTEHVGSVFPLQDLERLSLHVHFGTLARLSADFQTALGGASGGATFAGGLRAGFNFR
jgi:hypothetical protein